MICSGDYRDRCRRRSSRVAVLHLRSCQPAVSDRNQSDASAFVRQLVAIHSPTWRRVGASTVATPLRQHRHGFWTCDMCGVLYQALAKCSQCPARGPGGKGIVGGKTDMADQGKKGFSNQKRKYGNQWQADAADYGKPNKGKAAVYQWHQPNTANEWYMTKEPRMEETALVGNRTRFTKHSPKVNKPNRLRITHSVSQRGTCRNSIGSSPKT